MKTKNLVTTALLAVGVNGFSNNNPNVLFIAIDDLNDYISCMDGSVSVPTPNIDKLAKSGVLFTNAHCQAPISGPSRASIMTGMYPSNTGNYLQLKDFHIKKGNGKVKDAIFMPDYFEEHGYKSFGVGKIYHGADQAKTFDEYGGGFDWFGPKPKKRFKYDPEKIPHKVGKTQTDWGAYPAHDSLMTDFKIANWAVNKLKSNIEDPVFMAVGFLRPHVPWYVPQKWLDKFPIENIKLPPYLKEDYIDIPAMSKSVNNAPQMPTTEEMLKNGEWKYALQAYYACISFVDAQVGKVLDALDKSKYAKNTIIVLWADHGYHLGEKNRFAKQSLWERSTRTVLIFKDQENRNKKVSKPVQLVDIYPTLIELCELPKQKQLDGYSLKKYIQGAKVDSIHPALSFYGEGNIAVRGERYRLIQYEDGSIEFYDMFEDPNEWKNLSNRKKYQKHIERLRKFIPEKWEENSKYSYYKFNKYFKSKLNR
jgi:arylsulfatase A-like enzyme